MTTTAPSNAHPPATQAAHGQPANASRTGQGQQQPTDLFSSLLALLSPDAAPLDPQGGELAGIGLPGDDPLADDGTPTDNPLALLMAWTAPHGLEPAPLTGEGSLAGETRGLDTRADRLGTTPADGLLTGNGTATGRQVAAPWQPTARTQASPATTATHPFAPNPAGAPSGSGDVPATRWSRAASAADTGANAWPMRSTVALDTRFQAATPTGTVAAFAPGMAGAADADDLALPGASPTGGARAIGEAAASGVGASADAGLGGEASAEGGTAQGDSGTDQNTAQDPYAAPADAEAVEVQHWGAGAMRHASLRVGEDAQSAIDIQLALRGDEVQLDIRTDDAAAREALREQAQAALGERLQQGGLTLGQVSVGEQGQGQGHGEFRRDGHAAPATAHRGERASADSAETAAARPASPGANDRGLDLFV